MGYGKPRRLIANTAQVLTKAFTQPPSSLTDVNSGAAATGYAVHNILKLAVETNFYENMYFLYWLLIAGTTVVWLLLKESVLHIL